MPKTYGPDKAYVIGARYETDDNGDLKMVVRYRRERDGHEFELKFRVGYM